MAEPMKFGEALDKGYIRESEADKHEESERGYHVVYDNPDGTKYHSWGPEKVFETAYFSPVLYGVREDLSSVKESIREKIKEEINKMIDELI